MIDYKVNDILYREHRSAYYKIVAERYVESKNETLFTCKPLNNDDREFVSYYPHKIDEEMQIIGKDNKESKMVSLLFNSEG